MQGIMDYDPDVTYDVVLCLGSINFGDTNKILNELEHVVNLTSPDGKIFFRVNPGLMHDPMEAPKMAKMKHFLKAFILETERRSKS